ncbi:MAG: sensor histidine kinase [Pseudonocardia sp.]
MTARDGSRWITTVAVIGTVVVVGSCAAMLARGRPPDVWYALYLFINAPSAVALFWIARHVLRGRPGHRAGQLLLAVAVVEAVHVAAATLTDIGLVAVGITAPLTEETGTALVLADLPLTAAVPLFVMAWCWVPAPVLVAAVLPLVFPDGRLLSPRWRIAVAVAAAGAGAVVVALAVDAWPGLTTAQGPAVVAPLATAGLLAVAGATIAGLVALGLRWHRAGPDERWPFRVVGSATTATALVIVALYPWQWLWVPAVHVAFAALFVVYGLAVARYRLHDLEPVLGRAAVAAVLSALVAGVYLTVVVGLGSLLGRTVESSLLPLVAVATVALSVEPVRRRTRRLVDRVLHRRRVDRTEVLSRLASRAGREAGGDSTTTEVLEEVTELLVRSTGAVRAEMRPDVAGAPACTGSAATGVPAVPLVPVVPVVSAGAPPTGTAPVLQADVVHRGERFGTLCLYAWAAGDLVPDAPQLLGDVADALGLVLRNDRLTTELRARLDELQASRQRLVEAQDRARRSLERDIHDGAQARLIAVRLRLGALRARTVDGTAAEEVAGELDALGREVDAAVRSLRELARGLHPPVLEHRGIADAVRAGTRDLGPPVAVTARGLHRYPRAVEAAVYFACLEAVQNAVRHGTPQRVAVDLEADAESLRFCVQDDGCGFDARRAGTGVGLAGIADRVAALGGRARVRSGSGGTRVSGRIPVRPVQVPVSER